jgi:hypothetical protein
LLASSNSQKKNEAHAQRIRDSHTHKHIPLFLSVVDLSHAGIRIAEHGRLVASATYHLNGKGGFDMASGEARKRRWIRSWMSCWRNSTDVESPKAV